MRSFDIIDNHLVFNEYHDPEIIKIPLQELFDSLDDYKSN